MSKKEEFFKERFKQALDSTYKVISGEFDNLSKKLNYDLIRVGRGILFHITPSNVPINFAFSDQISLIKSLSFHVFISFLDGAFILKSMLFNLGSS